MQYYPFVVHDKPFCVWEWDLDTRNRDYLDRIDPGYFAYIAECNIDLLDGEHAQRAAIAIKTSYHHGLETLFALLFAVTQAPGCIPGWLRKYQTSQLRSLVEQASGRRGRVLNRLGIQQVNWHTLAETIIAVKYDSDEKTEETKTAFSGIWARFASDYLDKIQQAEYNSIKHGFRIHAGGFQLAVGEEHSYGVAPPPEQMKQIGGSIYGTAFFEPELPNGMQQNEGSTNFRIRQYNHNWDPVMIALRLKLISMSISNIVSFAKIITGTDQKKVKFTRPVEVSEFRRPWSTSVGVNTMNMDTIVSVNDIQPLSNEDILDIYRPTSEMS